MIGSPSTGGLRTTVDECIAACMSLSDKVFEKKSY